MRINFYGGPCAGKSTTAAWVFSELKRAGVSVELVGEYVKNWAYQKREVNYYDQVYLFGKQMQYEYGFLSRGVDNIVSDSPLFLNYCYTKKYVSERVANPVLDLIKHYDEDYEPLHIFLDRKDKPYRQEGRFQNEEQAKEIDSFVLEELLMYYDPDSVYIEDFNDSKKILDLIKSKL